MKVIGILGRPEKRGTYFLLKTSLKVLSDKNI